MNTLGWGNTKGWIKTAIILFVVASILPISSCGKNKSTNPTPPGSPPGGNSGGDFSSVSVGFGIINSNAQATILHSDLLFDGTTIASDDHTTASTTATLAALLVAPNNAVKKGQHTILLKMTNQTSSPNTYKIFGQIQTLEGLSTNRTYEIGMNGDLEKSLATGESFSWTVDLQ